MAYQILFPVLGLLLLVFGWPLAARRVRPNHWYGLRIPATFADKRVWYDANAVAGRDMMVLGVIVSIIALGLPHVISLEEGAYAGTCAALVGLGSLVLAVRGWRVANRMLREQHREGTAS
jgi:uncharacterized membrane protein